MSSEKNLDNYLVERNTLLKEIGSDSDKVVGQVVGGGGCLTMGMQCTPGQQPLCCPNLACGIEFRTIYDSNGLPVGVEPTGRWVCQ